MEETENLTMFKKIGNNEKKMDEKINNKDNVEQETQ